MGEAMRKGADSFESDSSSFAIIKGKHKISYSYGCFDLSEEITCSELDLTRDCVFLLFPDKPNSNILILTTKYIRSIAPDGILRLREIDKNQILYSDRYEIQTRKDDLLDASFNSVSKK